MEKKEVIVDSELEGMRLDRYLRKNFKDEPLSRIFGVIRTGDVKVNGKKSRENYRLLLNDKIIIKNLFQNNLEQFEKIKNKAKKFEISKNEFKKYQKIFLNIENYGVQYC